MVSRNYFNLSQVSNCHTNYKLVWGKTDRKNCSNLYQVSHCHTNLDAVRGLAKTTSIFLRCHTVTQIVMQWDKHQKLLQSFLGVGLSHKSQCSKMVSNNYFSGVTLSHKSQCNKEVGQKYFNLSQVSHCHTYPDAVRRSAKTTSIFLRCHTVTQIPIQ
jgi:hypothetical protein